MKTSNNTYKILVLSDLKGNASNTLKSTISLAKIIHGEIDLFHVKKLTEIVGKENQLSAMRTINSQYSKTEKKIHDLIKPFKENYGAHIHSSFSFGNVKDEIEKYINESQPDMIVLGKRKANPFSLIGDSITQFVMKKHKGPIMIASGDHILEPNQTISLGMIDGIDRSLNVDFAESLIENAQRPLKSFRILKNSEKLEKNPTPVNQKMVEYVFEQGDHAIKSLSNYLSKNNINLLCVNRESNYPINKLEVSLLVAN